MLAIAAVLLTSNAGAASPPSRTIELGRSIGGVAIGESVAKVQARYGRPAKTSVFAKGTPEVWSMVRYRVRDRSLWVSYSRGNVVAVETNSPLFRVSVPPGPTITDPSPAKTAGVGSRIYGGYSGECDVLGYAGACDAWLLGFHWSEDCQAWVDVYRGTANVVSLVEDENQSAVLDKDSRGTVGDIEIGIPNYTLHQLNNACAS
jgi:hypothetical protein